MAGLISGLMGTTAWQTAAAGAPGGPTALQLAISIAACAILALMALGPREAGVPAATEEERQPTEEHSRLLAQMHHELRTPLNAMIGFSEVMLRELHGPLGNARYQEYAAHISESGGRLLKASEDALAVAATMSALVADRRALQRERLPAAALLRDAWAALGAPGRMELTVADSATVSIECDRQATSQALQHLLAEAMARTPCGGGIVAATASRGASSIEIAGTPGEPGREGLSTGGHAPQDWRSAPGDGLRIILARSLLEMQGATLSLCSGPEAAGWSARIAFPVAAAARRQAWRPSPPSIAATAATRRPASPGRRGGFAAGAAAHASAGSHAAPPA
jgi:K+-sensing histidine kinase KdpD